MPEACAGACMTIAALLGHVRRQLREAGIEPAALEARHLVGALTGTPPEAFLAHPETLVGASDRRRVLDGLASRLAGMPIGRIIGEREFYGRPFLLGPDTLEPRADSEVLVDAVLEIVRREGLGDSPLRLLDVGTGTGCLLLTLLAELPRATGTGVDIAEGALAVARQNARRLGVASRAEFIARDLLAGVDGCFDILISNPPYIRSGDISGLDIEVREHDPPRALDGGPDGLSFYRRIGSSLQRVVPSGWVVFEVGAGMADAVRHEIDALAVLDPDQDWQVWQDIHGHKRCVAFKTLNRV